MVDDDKNKNGEPDFDDDAFDEADIVDADFEDADFESIDDDEDASFDDEDFGEEEEWADDEEQPVAGGKKGKKPKSLYTQDKKPFLSFNAMVILGAMLLGGAVMVYTVFSQGAQVAAGKKSIFQSGLNIAEFMDGGIFGKDAAEQPTTPETTEQPAGTPEETQPDLLANPELTPNELPQPTPIAPVENGENEPLTPMPFDEQMPRGPEEFASDPAAPDAVTPETPPVATTPENPAQALLEKVVAEREKTPVQEETAVLPEPAIVQTPVAEVKPEPVIAPEPEIVAPAPVVAGISEEEKKALEEKIAGLQKTIDNLQGELGTIRKSSSEETSRLQKTVKELEDELQDVKSRPAQVVVAGKPEVEDQISEPVEPKPVIKKKVTPKAVSKPAHTKAAAVAAPRWELRAAQPGKAWVSKSGQRDMQGVQVGENLPGIGRITAITYQGGRWAVIGTQGQVLQ